MKPVDQMHVMRKIVVDGSNTSGSRGLLFSQVTDLLKPPRGVAELTASAWKKKLLRK